MKKTIQILKQKKEFTPVVLASAPDHIKEMQEETLHEKIFKAVAVMKWAMTRYETSFSFSGGKDSSVMAALSLIAAAQLAQEQSPVQRFVFLSSNTTVENPEVLNVLVSSLMKIKHWISEYKLPGKVTLTEPYLLNQWAVAILGGQSLISTPLTNRDCTTDLKSTPLDRARKAAMGKNNIAVGKFTVGVTGVRFDESTERSGNMSKRGESPVDVVQTSADGAVFIAPIATWSTDDVMEFIGLASNREALPEEDRIPYPIYSDMKDVWRIYKDAEGECTVGRGDAPSKGCGARHGCYVCSMVGDDKSMNAFLNQDRYSYMQPLSDFRAYLNNTVFDYSKRTWIGRSIENGYVKYGPDIYSGDYLQDLLRYALTIDVEEQVKAGKLGISPRFQLISLRALIAIDALWSLHGLTLPFAALAIYHDVYVKGLRFPIPKTQKVEHEKPPKARYIRVKSWDEGTISGSVGLYNPYLNTNMGPCAQVNYISHQGQTRPVMLVQTDKMFDVDTESADMLLEFELEELVQRHQKAMRGISTDFRFSGQAYTFYVQYGVISISPAMVGQIDQILRRSHWRENNRLAGFNFDKAHALEMSLEDPVPYLTEPALDPSTRAQQLEQMRIQKRRTKGVAVGYGENSRRISISQLYAEWAPNVPWIKFRHGPLPMHRLMAHRVHLGSKTYAPDSKKGWALHHFVTLGELVAFLKVNPSVARQVALHRAPVYRKQPLIPAANAILLRINDRIVPVQQLELELKAA